MPMRKSTRREIRKLRELVHFLLAGRKCCFCKQPVFATPGAFNPGNGDGPRFFAKITVHHRDGDHENSVPSNTRLCHQSCHKAHHARKLHRTGVLRVKGRSS